LEHIPDHMLKDGVDYQELGHDYLDKLQP